jgi:hypothetical protein
MDPESVDRKKTRVRKKKEAPAPVEGLLFQMGGAFGEESDDDMSHPSSKKPRLTSDDFIDPNDSYYSTSAPASDTAQDYMREESTLAPFKYVPAARVELAPLRYLPGRQVNDVVEQAAPGYTSMSHGNERVELAPFRTVTPTTAEPERVELALLNSPHTYMLPIVQEMVEQAISAPALMDVDVSDAPVKISLFDLVRAAEEAPIEDEPMQLDQEESIGDSVER